MDGVAAGTIGVLRRQPSNLPRDRRTMMTSRIHLGGLTAGVRELSVDEMRQAAGGWNPFKSAWNGIKKAAKAVWNVLKKPYVGIPLVIALGGTIFSVNNPQPPAPGGPYHPPV